MSVPAPSTAALLEAWEREAMRPGPVPGSALLDAAWPQPPAGGWGSAHIGVRDAALLALRSATFGDVLVGLASCPACGSELELTFSAGRLLDSGSATDDHTVSVRADGYRVTAGILTVADLESTAGATDLTAARMDLLRRSVCHASDSAGPVRFDDLPTGVLDEVEDRLAAADPQADMRFALQCPDCGQAWEEGFDIATFFWEEVQAWAARTLDDVHQLASAYGWREQDVLAMGERRRQVYLEMAGS